MSVKQHLSVSAKQDLSETRLVFAPMSMSVQSSMTVISKPSAQIHQEAITAVVTKVLSVMGSSV